MPSTSLCRSSRVSAAGLKIVHMQEGGNSFLCSCRDDTGKTGTDKPLYSQRRALGHGKIDWTAEKPVLAKDGSNVLLRFSRLFNETPEPHKWHPNLKIREAAGRNCLSPVEALSSLQPTELGSLSAKLLQDIPVHMCVL